MKRPSQKTIILGIIVILLASAAYVFSQKIPTSPVEESTFTYNQKPINPDCLYDFILLSPDKTMPDIVNLATCSIANTSVTSNTFIENHNPNQVTSYLADHFYTQVGSTEPIQEGWTQYSVIKSFAADTNGDRRFIIKLAINSGGTGVFSEIQKVTITQDGNLKKAGTIMSGGDRCNGGISTAYADGNTVIIHADITPYDLLSAPLAQNHSSHESLLSGLDGSAIACIGTLQFNYSIDTNTIDEVPTFMFPPITKDAETGKDILPLLPETAADFPDTGESSQINLAFNKIYNDYLRRGVTKLSLDELTKFSEDFVNNIK